MNANNGIVAIEIVKKEKPDIVFLDVMMPKMNGLEVCSIIKNDLLLNNIYIIMLTAKGQEIDKQKAKGIGADFYITKPFNIKEIVEKVSDILSMNHS